MSYRIEISPNNRAGCSSTQCKKDGTKILKGEIRQAVMVMFQEKQSWKYRHWGCVTPAVLHNWKETTQMDMELVDGYDDLPKDAQEKVERALELEHVDDQDWKGDVECNRFNPDKKNQGMFLKTPKKSADDGEEEAQDSPTKKPAPKKRGRAKVEDEDEDNVPAKKTKSRSKKAVEEDAADEEAAPVKKSKKAKMTHEPIDEEVSKPAPATKKPRGKKAKADTDADVAMEEPATAPAARKPRGKKAKADTDADADMEEPAAAPTAKKPRGKKAKADANTDSDIEEPAAAPAKETNGKANGKAKEKANGKTNGKTKGKTNSPEAMDAEDDEPVAPKPQQKRKGRGKKAAASEED